MDSKWFAEDRKLPKEEQKEAIEKSKEALRNSTIFRRRLEGILKEELEKSYLKEEDFEQDNWERIHISEVSNRKTLRKIIKLIQLGG
jgi:hypothetical protein